MGGSFDPFIFLSFWATAMPWWRTTRLALAAATVTFVVGFHNGSSCCQAWALSHDDDGTLSRHGATARIRKSGGSAAVGNRSSRGSSGHGSMIDSSLTAFAEGSNVGTGIASNSDERTTAASLSAQDLTEGTTSLSKLDLLARVHQLHSALNDAQIAAEDEKARCRAIVTSTKTEQLRLASRQVEELSSYSQSLQAEAEAKATEEKQRLTREIELLGVEKVHLAQRQHECETRVERWRNVSAEQKTGCTQQVSHFSQGLPCRRAARASCNPGTAPRSVYCVLRALTGIAICDVLLDRRPCGDG